MTTCRFSFSRMGGIDPRPLLPIRVTSKETRQSINVYALIDTGARMIALPRAYAGLLGLSARRLKRDQVGTAGGLAKVHVASCNVQIIVPKSQARDNKIAGPKPRQKGKVFDTVKDVKVLFLPGLSEPLIGVDNLLIKYILEVNYREGTFSLSK